MTARGDIGFAVAVATAPTSEPIPGAVGMGGSNDVGRAVAPAMGSAPSGPTLPTFGQIFPSGR